VKLVVVKDSSSAVGVLVCFIAGAGIADRGGCTQRDQVSIVAVNVMALSGMKFSYINFATIADQKHIIGRRVIGCDFNDILQHEIRIDFHEVEIPTSSGSRRRTCNVVVAILKDVLVVSNRGNVVRVGICEFRIAVEKAGANDMCRYADQVERGVIFAQVDSARCSDRFCRNHEVGSIIDRDGPDGSGGDLEALIEGHGRSAAVRAAFRRRTGRNVQRR